MHPTGVHPHIAFEGCYATMFMQLTTPIVPTMVVRMGPHPVVHRLIANSLS